jgi:hypothetical protein
VILFFASYRAAHAAEPKQAFMDTLEPLDVPAAPVSEVLFLSITHSARDERLALWMRLAKLEVCVLELQERIAALETKQ